MGMVVRTNTMAQNAYRQLGVNNTAVGKSLEKLSSGFRINRAADDASGLAISEKMKAQIKGLEQASANSQDGISLIQTAEGATTEIHNMLNRMTELATKSSNGTIQDPVDREAIQQEVNDLNKEITRIAQSTNFNGINLLDGNLSAKGAAGAAGVPGITGLDLADVAAVKGEQTVQLTDAGAAGTALSDGDVLKTTINYTDANGKSQSTTLELVFNGTDKTLTTKGGKTIALAAGTHADKAELAKALAAAAAEDTGLSAAFKVGEGTTGEMTFDSRTAGANTKINSVTVDYAAAGSSQTVALINPADGANVAADAYQSFDFANAEIGKEFSVGGKKFAFFDSQADAVAAGPGVNGIVLATAGTIANADVVALGDLIEQKTGYKAEVDATTTTQLNFKAPTAGNGTATGGLKLQVGDTNADYNHVTVSIDDLSAKGIGTEGLDVSTQDAAGDAIDTIRTAINQVSTNRANLGSLQNRLEYTINNLDTTAENMTAANSRIRDTDMAKEMMNYTKMNILTQSAQAMLAQANQQPQAILQLLQ